MYFTCNHGTRCDYAAGLDQMLDENRIEDLTLFYQLLSRVHHGLKELCTSFAAYIKVSFNTHVSFRAVLWLHCLCQAQLWSHAPASLYMHLKCQKTNPKASLANTSEKYQTLI